MAVVHDERGRRRAAAPAGLLLTVTSQARAALSQTEWSHHCSACGKCCNSPPQLSVPELFHHQETFFGCLTVRRVQRVSAADDAELAALEALAERLWHRLPGASPHTDDILLATQGLDLGLSNRCPALDAEQRCSLHARGKPVICRVVPLDALRPDRVQHQVLASRAAEARYLGSDCISAGKRAGFELITQQLNVVEQGARRALEERRDDLAQERRFWGNAVFQMLRAELFSRPERVAELPSGGFMTLSLAPVLMVLADASPRARARSIAYLDAQSVLGERMLREARAPGPAEPASVRQLDAFAGTNRRLRNLLLSAPPPLTRCPLPNALHSSIGSASLLQPKRVFDMSYSETTLDTSKRLNISPEAVQTYLDAGRGERGAGVERSLHTTIKPVGSACNLDCTYCYYLSKEELLSQKSRRMKDDVLERFIIDYIKSQDAEEIAFTWHGGEPTLMGLGFFRRVVELQRQHLPTGRRISNDLQTNGTLLDDEWCKFLAENAFLVGISIDGPRALHDFYRPTKKGKPTFDKVFEATQRLKRYGIQFSALTTVNRHNSQAPLEVYRFLRDEVGARYIQFIPCVEPKQFERHAPAQLPAHQLVTADSARARPGHPMSVVTDWSVESEAWGSFLAAVFDEWQASDQGRVKINLFESLFAQLNGQPSLMCTSSPFCGKNVALESDGRVYSCDHFVYPEYELGKVGDQTLAEMVFSLKQLEFGLDKHNSLPSECRACPYLKLCWGECPRTRILKTREGEGNLSYLCSGWKLFFAHALPKIPRRSAAQAPLFPATSLLRANNTESKRRLS